VGGGERPVGSGGLFLVLCVVLIRVGLGVSRGQRFLFSLPPPPSPGLLMVRGFAGSVADKLPVNLTVRFCPAWYEPDLTLPVSLLLSVLNFSYFFPRFSSCNPQPEGALIWASFGGVPRSFSPFLPAYHILCRLWRLFLFNHLLRGAGWVSGVIPRARFLARIFFSICLLVLSHS